MMDQDPSDVCPSENKDSGYGSSLNNQQSNSGSGTGSGGSRDSRSGGGSIVSSETASGSETSSLGKQRKKRDAGAACNKTAKMPPEERTSGCSAIKQEPTETTEESDTTTDPSNEDGEISLMQKEAYRHVLSCMRKIVEREKGSQSPSPDTSKVRSSRDSGPREDVRHTISTRLEVLVCLRKGTVVKTSASMAEILGYPADMWVGRSFIDYVYPKDRASFTSNISMGMDIGPQRSNQTKERENGTQLFCRLRHYRGLSSVGFNIVSRTHIYKPFNMRIMFPDGSRQVGAEGPCMLVVADVLQPAYLKISEGDESYENIIFSMRHTASCRINHFDQEGITLLGHLPQDILGSSITEFFHPEDLPDIKDTYRQVIQKAGVPFRGRPYRFRAHNGSYVRLETDWSCFVNPWSSRIESVICQHRVTKPPKKRNVFDDDEDGSDGSDCVDLMASSDQLEIESILSKPLASPAAADPHLQYMAQRRRRLVALMENLITELETVDDITQPTSDEQQQSLLEPVQPPEQDHTSVPGDVSPHTTEQGSASPSSATTPNYTQLNYNETIIRFFESHPKTTMGSSDDSDGRNASSGGDINGGPSGNQLMQSISELGEASATGGSVSQSTSGGLSAAGRRSAAGAASASNDALQAQQPKQREQQSQSAPAPARQQKQRPTPAAVAPAAAVAADTGHGRGQDLPPDYQHCPLTQAVLDRHNADMEKYLRRQCHETKKLIGQDGKSKSGKRRDKSRGRDHRKESLADFEYERRRSMADTPAWPAPSLFWPPLSTHVVPQALTQGVQCGYWMVEQQANAARTAPGLVSHPAGMLFMPIAKPVYLTAGVDGYPAVGGPAAAGEPLELAVGRPGCDPAADGPLRRKPKDRHHHDLHRASDGGSSHDRPVPPHTAATNTENQEKVGVIDDISAKAKDGSDGGISDSSISSLLKDVELSCADSLSGGWLDMSENEKSNSTDSRNKGDSPQVGCRLEDKRQRPVLKEPPWLEGVSLSSDVINRYQMEPRNMDEVLKRDRQALTQLQQPEVISDQLSQFYDDLETLGAPAFINLEEREGTSSSSDDSCAMRSNKLKRRRKLRDYDRLTILYEEDSPVPPPELPAAGRGSSSFSHHQRQASPLI